MSLVRLNGAYLLDFKVQNYSVKASNVLFLLSIYKTAYLYENFNTL